MLFVLYNLLIALVYIAFLLLNRDQLESRMEKDILLIYEGISFVIPFILSLLYLFMNKKISYGFLTGVTIGYVGSCYANALCINEYTGALGFYYSYSIWLFIPFLVALVIYILISLIINNIRNITFRMIILTLLNVIWVPLLYFIMFVTMFRAPA